MLLNVIMFNQRTYHLYIPRRAEQSPRESYIQSSLTRFSRIPNYVTHRFAYLTNYVTLKLVSDKCVYTRSHIKLLCFVYLQYIWTLVLAI